MERWPASKAILAGGAIGGLGDILFAIGFAAWNGTPPVRLLQIVASGWLGEASFQGGLATAALGLGSHFAIAIVFAGVYLLASRRIGILTAHPVVAGMIFGAGVFLFMRLVVLPLSAFPYPVVFRPLSTVLDGLSHMFLFGLPIALAARKAAAR